VPPAQRMSIVELPVAAPLRAEVRSVSRAAPRAVVRGFIRCTEPPPGCRPVRFDRADPFHAGAGRPEPVRAGGLPEAEFILAAAP